ncbi:hypothetical protein C7S20_16510 [Christiangramia fulva]|uniref:Secretion system C-terminal sorting domain-containing protein n=1 Tax=Christiangramia fulva TaxID=2126553 RepID=A0A2R3Z8Y7_9FLAO|nr:T9SS type A sorting domain-containing protein [Christiangramia fulva]AVR46738.1 hypothetical protein C7S20_16510 [Christiangramia fulva]
MKLPLLFVVIFISSGLYAQLYVAPSKNSDSYLYVRDRVIFVKNELNLQENREDETSASIYLRKDAQLVQGSENNLPNPGEGKISVYQKGTSNAYDYNYWSLPVRRNGSNSQLNDFIYEPMGKTKSRKSRLTNSLNGSSSPLTISRKWIYSFSGIDYSNWQYAGENFDLLPGQGFTMKGVEGVNNSVIEGQIINSGSAQVYDFRGIPNNGQIDLPISKDQILLVGNPYPSTLNLDLFLTENTATTGIAYFWDSGKDVNSHMLSDYEGGYGTYSPGASLYVPAIFQKYLEGKDTGNTGEVYGRKFSPIGQGFMVIGKENGKLFFGNNQRAYQKEDKDLSQFKSPIRIIPSLKINVEMDSSYTRQLALAFRNDSTLKEDHAMDARNLDAAISDISWDIDGENFVINVLPAKEKDLIPLFISLNKATSLNISVSELSNFNPDRILIFDTKEDLYYGIKTGYFQMSLPAGDYRNRFYLTFVENLPAEEILKEGKKISVSKPKNVLLNSIDIFQNNAEERLELKILYSTDFSNIQLYDLNGKLIFRQNFKEKQKEYYLPTGKLSSSVYIVKVKTTDNKELTKKITVKN